MERYEYSAEQRAILESMRVPFAVYQMVDKRVVTLILSDGLCSLFGYEDREAAYADMDHNIFQYEHPDDAARIANMALQFAQDKGPFDVIYRAKAKGSSDYHMIHAVGQHIQTASGVRLAQICYMDEGLYTGEHYNDTSALSCSLNDALHEESILRENYYDHLTGLPSMTYFFDLAEAGKAADEKAGSKTVMMFFDLCGMKYYNTKYGFSEGDKLLRSFATLLSETFSINNCCRAGADHFAVYARKDGIEDILKQLFLKVRDINDGNSIPVHVGIYVSGTENISASGAFDRAKIASDSLKTRYGCCYGYYSMKLSHDVEKRQYILSNLDRAIEEGWIQVYYQGIVRAVTGKICDEEALARWIDPEKGPLSPADFIPYLEDAGLIYKLDLCVLDQVLKKINELKRRGHYIISHSINLSRSDFDSCDMVEEIRRRVDEAGVSRNKISIEITESIIGSDFEYIKSQVERFRNLGFPVWMDDFGSGYSSLDVLQSVRFDLLKFDMSFMKKFNEGGNGKIVLTELMRLATKLGVDTICEGVETQAQVRFLQEIGCSKLQGYYFHKPTPLSVVMQNLDQMGMDEIENPEESEYYESIGRANLYDFSELSTKDASLHNVFSTLPMGIVELKDGNIHYVRSNQPYREYLRRFFGFEVSKNDDDAKVLFSVDSPYGKLLSQCCTSRNHALIDEQMPDGSVVHSFVRQIGVNPVKGTTAAAIAILSVTDSSEGTTYTDIARALVADYYKMYYVDLLTDKFIEYSLPTGEERLTMERHGDDFFNTVKLDQIGRISVGDRDVFLSRFTKEHILKELDEHGAFTKRYRLGRADMGMFASLKITRMPPDNRYLIIGISIVRSAWDNDAEYKAAELYKVITQRKAE